MDAHTSWMRKAVELAAKNVEQKGGKPFGALLVRSGVEIGTGVNDVLASGDPTAHAEMQAIRAACREVGPDLSGAIAYPSGHPCPMCLAALYLAGVSVPPSSSTCTSTCWFPRVCSTTREPSSPLPPPDDVEVSRLSRPSHATPSMPSSSLPPSGACPFRGTTRPSAPLDAAA